MIHAGIDLHSRSMTLVAINDNGKVLDEQKLATTPAKLREFFAGFTGPVQAVVECTSYWYWVADWCSGQVEAGLLLEQIRLTQDHIATLEAAIEEQMDFHRDVERLKVLPGFGLVCAWTIVAEVGDITRFPSAKQFVSYCRLVPGARDSGGKHRHRSRNKDGNRYLRIAFNQAAIIAYCDYPVVKEFYKKVTRRSGKHVARTVVGKELAKIVWHMLTKNEEYKGFPQRDPFGKRQDDPGHHPKLLATTHKPERITEKPQTGKLAPLDWEMGCWFGLRSGIV